MRKGFALTAGMLATAATGLITSRYRREIRIARKRAAWGSRLVTTPRGLIEYSEAGRGPALLSIHGAGGGFDQGLTLANGLKDDFHIIAMSRFGYLRTPLPENATAENQADAHAALMDALGVEKASVIAYSAGAPSAMQLAIRHPDRVSSLVLVVPAAFAPRPDNAPPMKSPKGLEYVFATSLRWDFIFWASKHATPDTLIRTILGTPPEDLAKVSVAERERVLEVLEEILPISARRTGLTNDAKVTSTLGRYDLEKIEAPTLLVSVADDGYGTFDGARYSAEHIPDSRFIGYATGGHLLAGHQQDLSKEISRFLKQASVRPAARRAKKATAPRKPVRSTTTRLAHLTSPMS